MTILVEPADGCCNECGGQLAITDADDISLTAECQDCGEAVRVETDGFGDGGIDYWPRAMVELGEEQ